MKKLTDLNVDKEYWQSKLTKEVKTAGKWMDEWHYRDFNDERSLDQFWEDNKLIKVIPIQQAARLGKSITKWVSVKE